MRDCGNKSTPRQRELWGDKGNYGEAEGMMGRQRE